MQTLNEHPNFEDIGEGLAYMDELRDAEIARMEEEARVRMQADQGDPTTQQYFLRLDRKTVVKNEEEYVRCQLQGVQMKVIPYSFALQALKEEDARKRQEKKAKAKRKNAAKARRKNR